MWLMSRALAAVLKPEAERGVRDVLRWAALVYPEHVAGMTLEETPGWALEYRPDRVEKQPPSALSTARRHSARRATTRLLRE